MAVGTTECAEIIKKARKEEKADDRQAREA